jgi:hypothetical protein
MSGRFILGVLFGLLLLGCETAVPSASSGPAGALDNPAPVTTSNRPPAPDFTANTTTGNRFALSEQRGKAVVLFFTAPG